jgi:hypothetical protein
MTKGKDGPNGSLHDEYGEVNRKTYQSVLRTCGFLVYATCVKVSLWVQC